VPAVNPLVLTATTNHDVPVEDDAVSETVSQEALSEAVNVLLEFVLVAVNVWFGGLSAPSTAENVRDVGLTVIVVDVVVEVVDWEKGDTINVTGTVVLADVVSLIVMVAL